METISIILFGTKMNREDEEKEQKVTNPQPLPAVNIAK